MVVEGSVKACILSTINKTKKADKEHLIPPVLPSPDAA